MQRGPVQPTRGSCPLLVVAEAGAHEMAVLKGPARAIRHGECLRRKKQRHHQRDTQKRSHRSPPLLRQDLAPIRQERCDLGNWAVVSAG